MAAATAALGEDGKQWRRLFGPFAEHWTELAPEILRPVSSVSAASISARPSGIVGIPFGNGAGPVLVSQASNQGALRRIGGTFRTLAGRAANFGLRHHLRRYRPRCGMADSARRSQVDHHRAYADILRVWAARCTCRRGSRILPPSEGIDVALCDVTPRQLLRIAGDRLSPGYQRELERYRYGPGVFKVDYALSERDSVEGGGVPAIGHGAPRRHDGGNRRIGRCDAPRPTSPSGRSCCWRSRAVRSHARARGHAILRWAYCHVPNGSTVDMLPRIEAQIERFAPGFRDCVLERGFFLRQRLEAMDANLIGGDIGGGAGGPAAISVSSQRASTTQLRREISTSARPPRRPAAAYTACVATMRPKWRSSDCEQGSPNSAPR